MSQLYERLDAESGRAVEQVRADADQLLAYPGYSATMALLIRDYQKRLERSEHGEADVREDCYRMLRAIRELDARLTTLAKTGRLRAVRNSGDGASAAG